MNVLIIHSNDALLNDIEELSRDGRIVTYVAHSREEALSILAQTRIEKVLFALRTLPDLEFLKYINTSYKNIEVVLTVEENIGEIVNILRYGEYKILHTPFKFSELKACFEKGTSA